VDPRVVRFLLANLDLPVPEDLIFEALWPELSASSARSSLQVAVSRARRLLDPPGAEESAIESADRTYRLVLGEHGEVDAERFRSAARAALAEQERSASRSSSMPVRCGEASRCPRSATRTGRSRIGSG
jgi:DNA-binding SARP family transcriptional activator